MTKLQITTESFGNDALFPQRIIRIGDKSVQTPTKAISIRDTRAHEQVNPNSRGVNELYQVVDSGRLTRERRGTSAAISKGLQTGLNKANEDDLNIIFFSYEEANTLPVVDAQFLVNLTGDRSDIITVPLMPELARSIDTDNGLSDPAYRSYKKSVIRFLEQVQNHAPDDPVMGVVPSLGWDYVNDLMELYASYKIRAYCVNFDRSQITAENQVKTIKPLMQHIANRGIEENVLFYAINLSQGRRDQSLGARPAVDVASVGMGFDIIGDNHVPPRVPKEVFEKIEENQGEEDESITFRLFDRNDYLYRDIPLNQLPSEFPDESAFDPEHIVLRVQDSPSNAKYRLQRIVNAEQIALAMAELRAEMESGASSLDHIATKAGVSTDTLSTYRSVRESFDYEREQSGLSSF